ncbi:cell division protein FtsQ [Sinobacterium caligoides]|uniref:Cell division protein FtsQ n=2 Tax=Sinobacterium caligoides TaxID=933926 RepID=A0A3N2D549_9GAMM|nr:cell division protein FtsQ [Sinobacterium caligoides]
MRVEGNKRVKKGASRKQARTPLVVKLPFKAIAIVLLGCSSLVGGYYALTNLPEFHWRWMNDPVAVDSFIVKGRFEHIDRLTAEAVVMPYMQKDFYSIDLEQVRQDFLMLPWVESAMIQRVWPDKIEVKLAEQGVIARWGEGALLNQAGEVFKPSDISNALQLPLLEGPDGLEHKVMDLYQELSLMLGAKGPSIARLAVDNRYNWLLELDDGVRLILGDELMVERLRRFITVYPQLQSQPQAIKYVDLRYVNGLAVGWKSVKEENGNG